MNKPLQLGNIQSFVLQIRVKFPRINGGGLDAHTTAFLGETTAGNGVTRQRTFSSDITASHKVE